MSQRGEVSTLLGWYRAFPLDFVHDHPRLIPIRVPVYNFACRFSAFERDPGLYARTRLGISLYFGLAFALNGGWDEAETLLSYVERQASEHRPDEALLLAYLVASYRHDAARLAAIVEASASAQPDPLTRLVHALVVGRGTTSRRPAC